jgi:membrane protease YdiL (CAAX protease family)
MQSKVLPLALPFVRVAMVVVGALATAGILALLGQPAGWPAVSTLAVFYLLPVNILSLLIVRSLVHRDGGTLRGLIGFDRSRLGRDIAWGLLWLMVLWVPFMLAIMGSMFAMFGPAAFEQFETVFAPDPASLPALGPVAAAVFGVIAVVTFAPLNAPAEELVYRAYPIDRSSTPVLAVLLPSVAFAAQHVFFASTAPGMVVFAVAFFVWGLGSAVIYLRQRRLMPLIVAHVIVNLATSAPALILPFVL